MWSKFWVLALVSVLLAGCVEDDADHFSDWLSTIGRSSQGDDGFLVEKVPPCSSQYDEDGDGEVDYYFRYSYDGDGNLKFESVSTEEASPYLLTISRSYDDRGNPVAEYTYRGGEEVEIVTRAYIYNEHGDIDKEIVTNSLGEARLYAYSYIGPQRLLLKKDLWLNGRPDGRPDVIWQFGYQDNGSRKDVMWVYSGEPSARPARYNYSSYDEQGNLLVETQDLDGDGVLDYEIQREYDLHGNIVEAWLLKPGTNEYYEHYTFRHSYECWE